MAGSVSNGGVLDGAVRHSAFSAVVEGRGVRGALWALTVLYMAVVAFMTLWPVHIDDNAAGGFLHGLLGRGHAEGWLPGWFNYDLVEWLSNVVMFVPGGFLLGILLRPPVRWFVPVAGVCTTVGIESLQHFMPGRTSSVLDIWANSMGALLGWLVALVLIRWVSRARRS